MHSRELQREMDKALDLGFRCFKDGDQAPFIILSAGGKGQFIDLKSGDGTIGKALLEAGRLIIQKHAKMGKYYILVWDGYLTTAGKRQDAVLAEVGAAGEAEGVVFAQRYKKTKSGKMSKLGKPLVAARVEHLWSEASTKNGGNSCSAG